MSRRHQSFHREPPAPGAVGGRGSGAAGADQTGGGRWGGASGVGGCPTDSHPVWDTHLWESVPPRGLVPLASSPTLSCLFNETYSLYPLWVAWTVMGGAPPGWHSSALSESSPGAPLDGLGRPRWAWTSGGQRKDTMPPSPCTFFVTCVQDEDMAKILFSSRMRSLETGVGSDRPVSQGKGWPVCQERLSEASALSRETKSDHGLWMYPFSQRLCASFLERSRVPAGRAPSLALS